MTVCGEIMQKTVCRLHHFASNGRCSFCQIQRTYYEDCMAALNSWSQMEKQSNEWKDKVLRMRCRAHEHK